MEIFTSTETIMLIDNSCSENYTDINIVNFKKKLKGWDNPPYPVPNASKVMKSLSQTQIF